MNVTYSALRVMRHFLMARDPQCGAEITRELQIPSGTLYPMLARLRKEGWISHVATLPAPDRPDSHFYRITPEGHAAFLEMLCRLTIPSDLWRVSERNIAALA